MRETFFYHKLFSFIMAKETISHFPKPKADFIAYKAFEA